MLLISFFQIISAGADENILHWTHTGEMTARVPCSQPHVFSVVINEKGESKSPKVSTVLYSISQLMDVMKSVLNEQQILVVQRVVI